MLFALLALTLSQTPVPAPYPDEPSAPTDPAPPPVVEMAPPPETPLPPAVETPLRPEEIPPAPDAPTKPLPPPDGLGGFPTGLVQTGIGAGVAGVFTASLYVLSIFQGVPVVGIFYNVVSCVNCLVVPGAIGVLETAVGDAVGKQRGASIWPVVASYGGCCLVGTAQVVVASVFAGSIVGDVLAGKDPNVAAAELQQSPAFQVTNIVMTVLSPVIIAAAPAIAYGMTAEDKKPGDPGGLGMPGFMSPNHAGPMSTTPSTSGTSVMRF